MSEEWRRKAYYRTRVLIPINECLDSAFGDCLVCLTGGELNLIRNLLLYAERRSTFVDEYHDQYYLAPDNDDWDALQAMVGHLEGSMMDCEQFTTDLQEILDWVRLQSTLPGGTFSEGEQAAFPYDDSIADDELTPAEEDACDVAQLWFEWGYQVITEQVLPATRWGFDYLVPAVAGFIALAIGGPPAAMGVYALAEFIQELLEIFYRGSETNLVNWMDTNKEDIVCVLFGWLKVGGDASEIWEHVYDAVIGPAEDISYGDKLMLSLFMGSWAGSNAQLAFTAETEWATSNVEAGYCDECGEVYDLEMEYSFPPCPGPDGWWPSATKAECYGAGYPAAHRIESVPGHWWGPEFEDLLDHDWNLYVYVEWYSIFADTTDCATIDLERKYQEGAWQQTGYSETLESAGPSVWTSALFGPFVHSAPASDWKYRLHFKADHFNSGGIQQVVVREYNFYANLDE